MDSVEIQSAFKWTCRVCGHLNFHAGIAAEMTEADRKSLEEQLRAQTPDGEFVPEGEWIMAPKQVACERCEATFKADYGDEGSADPTEPFPKF